MTNMKPSQEGRNTGAPSLRGLKGRSATELNGQAARGRGVSSVAGGAGCRKIFLAFGREKCFSLDIPFYRTGAPSLRGLKGRSATELNGQAARGRGVSSVAGGAGCRKIFLAFGRGEVFFT